MARVSAFGWAARMARISGSRTGEDGVPARWAASRASLARTRRPDERRAPRARLLDGLGRPRLPPPASVAVSGGAVVVADRSTVCSDAGGAGDSTAALGARRGWRAHRAVGSRPTLHRHSSSRFESPRGFQSTDRRRNQSERENARLPPGARTRGSDLSSTCSVRSGSFGPGRAARTARGGTTGRPPRRRTHDQVDRRGRGTPGGEHVVDDEHPVAGRERVAVHLERRAAVLEVVARTGRSRRAACPSCAPARTRRRRWYATGAARMNPRASMPTTLSMVPGSCCATIASTTPAKAA